MSNEFEQTIELENNIKLKNQALDIYKDFINRISLDPATYKGDGKFLFWSDSHNKIYITIINDEFIFQCRFLHETYNVTITPAGIFHALKTKNRGVDHLVSHVSKPKP